jgi:hypothetical protein
MTDAPSSTDLGRSGIHTLVLRLTPFVGLVALATSALLLALRHADHGRIALPPATADVVVPSAEGDAAVVEEDEAEHDPFDQIDPEVWEDGVPLADDAFWRRTRLLGRLPLLGLSLGVLAVRLATFLVPVVSGWNTPSGLPLLADLVALGLYIWLAALAVSSLPLRDVPTHWRTVLHQASLLGTVSACRMLELLLPADGPNEVGQDDGTVLPTLRYAELGCLMVRLWPSLCSGSPRWTLTTPSVVRSSRRPSPLASRAGQRCTSPSPSSTRQRSRTARSPQNRRSVGGPTSAARAKATSSHS